MPWSTNRGVPGNYPRRLSGGCTKAALCLLHSIRNACQNSFRCKFALKSHEIRARWKGLAHMSHVLSLEPGGGGGGRMTTKSHQRVGVLCINDKKVPVYMNLVYELATTPHRSWNQSRRKRPQAPRSFQITTQTRHQLVLPSSSQPFPK